MLFLLIFIVAVVVYVVGFVGVVYVALLLVFGFYIMTYFYTFPDSTPKTVANADTNEVGQFIGTPHVTRIVFPLTGMD